MAIPPNNKLLGILATRFMKNPKISVIIPVYNKEKTLKQCLSSVLNQTYKNYEVIIVDNNSNDKSKEIIREFGKKNKKMRYLFESKISRGAARRKGGVNAKGEIILMIDSDCIVPKNWIKEIIEPIIKYKQVAVQGMIKPTVLNYWSRHIQEENKKSIKKMLKEGEFNWLRTGNFAIKRSVLRDVGYTNPDLVYAEDEELMVKLRLKNYKLYFKNTVVFHDYPKNPLELFKKKFKYGEWTSKIRKMYGDKKWVFLPETPVNHLRYILGITSDLLSLNKDIWYNLVSGIAWRAGRFYGWLIK